MYETSFSNELGSEVSCEVIVNVWSDTWLRIASLSASSALNFVAVFLAPSKFSNASLFDCHSELTHNILSASTIVDS